MSDVVERFSTNAPFIRKALQDAVAAVAVAKEAVSLVSSSGTANDSVTDSLPPATISRIPKATRKVSAGRTPAKKRTAKKKAAAPAHSDDVNSRFRADVNNFWASRR
jgi:hypothetical protein